LIPTVRIIDVVEHVGVAAPAAAAPSGHDDHGHGGGHDDHAAHDDHGHATATAEPAQLHEDAGKPSAPEPIAAAKAESAKAPEPPMVAPEKPAQKSPEEEDAAFKATWKVEAVARLDAGQTNFLLASTTSDA